jgi:hypothetical protein
VAVRCSHRGSPTVAAWQSVTKDFCDRPRFRMHSKKLGSVHVTRPFSHGRATPRLEVVEHRSVLLARRLRSPAGIRCR